MQESIDRTIVNNNILQSKINVRMNITLVFSQNERNSSKLLTEEYSKPGGNSYRKETSFNFKEEDGTNHSPHKKHCKFFNKSAITR